MGRKPTPKPTRSPTKNPTRKPTKAPTPAPFIVTPRPTRAPAFPTDPPTAAPSTFVPQPVPGALPRGPPATAAPVVLPIPIINPDNTPGVPGSFPGVSPGNQGNIPINIDGNDTPSRGGGTIIDGPIGDKISFAEILFQNVKKDEADMSRRTKLNYVLNHVIVPNMDRQRGDRPGMGSRLRGNNNLSF